MSSSCAKRPFGAALQGAQTIELGRIVMTNGVWNTLHMRDVSLALQRHASGDWGELDAADGEANNRALKEGTRVLSRYLAASGKPFWVITDADRSVTTVLLPLEY